VAVDELAAQQAAVDQAGEPARPRSDGAAPAPKGRRPDEIQADIHATRARLVENIETLKSRTKPKAVATNAAAKVKGAFVLPDGELRRERVAAAAGGVVVLLLLRRGLNVRRERKMLRQLAEVVWVPVPRRAVSPELAPLARNAGELAPLTADYAPRAITAG
jgi:hypothetical protein